MRYRGCKPPCAQTVAVPEPAGVMVRAAKDTMATSQPAALEPGMVMAGATTAASQPAAPEPHMVRAAAMNGAQRVVNPLCTVAVPKPARAMVRATGDMTVTQQTAVPDPNTVMEGAVSGVQRVANPLQLCSVAVPEPARAMLGATDRGHQVRAGAWLRFGAMTYAMKRSQARACLTYKYWKMKRVAAMITREVPIQQQWAPPAGASGHEGLSAEEFRRRSSMCRMWCLEESKTGPCRRTGTCGDQARVMLWQGPAVVSADRLARWSAASEKQRQTEAQLNELKSRVASAGVLVFHEECDRQYTSKAGTRTPCKMLGSKNGHSNVMFANGGASVCSAQLSWRQVPADAKRREQQAKEQQAKEQVVIES